MAAEDAAVGVQLVDDDVAQVLEQLRPARMVRQDPRVHHVGIAEHEVGARSDRAPRILRRVAVVGEHADLLAGRGVDRLAHRLQLRELILRQRLGRKQVERAARRILEDRVEHRRVVAERLARRRRRDDDRVATGQRVLDRFRLVRVELIDAARRERADQPRIERRGKRRELGRDRRQTPDRSDMKIGVSGRSTSRPPMRSSAASSAPSLRDRVAGSMAQHRTSGANKWQRDLYAC